MKRIINLIESKKELLENNKLFKWLSDESIDGYERLSFSPAMLYYLMGFKDVLSHLYRPKPLNDLEKHINAYCGEDSEHWRWYLRDLETLGYNIHSWGDTISKWCNNVWGPQVESNRTTIFHLINYATLSNDPLLAITLIMVFEATGVVFIGHTRKAAIAINMDNELKYFGKLHYEEEFGHSAQAKDFIDYRMSEETYKIALPIIDNLFQDYERLFECWHKNRSTFSYMFENKKRA